jgi:hypothetical protein
MAYNRSPRGSTQQQTTKVANVPAPTQGMDTRVNAASDTFDLCIYAYNIIPDGEGLRVREGYAEHQTGLTSPVNTIIPFQAPKQTDASNRIFAVTQEGIYDVTIQGAIPDNVTPAGAWNNTTDDAGWGTFVIVNTLAGEAYIFYADSINGLFRYNATLNIWDVPIDITFVDAEALVTSVNSVTASKNRLWFGVQNSSTGYYLGLDAIAGVADRFQFGTSFSHGGVLKGLFNWTLDGGEGVDDYLVAISSSGDILPFTGGNVESVSDWSIVGKYYAGAMATGGRCGSQQGGDLYILSTYGVLAMSDLIRGVDPRTNVDTAVSARVTRLLRTVMTDYKDSQGWDILNLPVDGKLVIVSPRRLNGDHIEYVYDIASKAWGIWRDIPIRCLANGWDAPLFGDHQGRILKQKDSLDNVKIFPQLGNINGENIKFSMLTGYSSMGTGGRFKRGVMVRSDFAAEKPPSYVTKFLYDYDINEILVSPSSKPNVGQGWDSSLWDQAVWAAGNAQSGNTVLGGSGIGRSLAIAIKGNALGGSLFLSFDVFWNDGGGL